MNQLIRMVRNAERARRHPFQFIQMGDVKDHQGVHLPGLHLVHKRRFHTKDFETADFRQDAFDKRFAVTQENDQNNNVEQQRWNDLDNFFNYFLVHGISK